LHLEIAFGDFLAVCTFISYVKTQFAVTFGGTMGAFPSVDVSVGCILSLAVR
jgi:hypothetical protein